MTGAGNGIGRCLALQLSKLGVNFPYDMTLSQKHMKLEQYHVKLSQMQPLQRPGIVATWQCLFMHLKVNTDMIMKLEIRYI